jgi:hypothetical protein
MNIHRVRLFFVFKVVAQLRDQLGSYIACDRTSSLNIFFSRIDQETCRIVLNTIRLKEKKGAEFISLSLFGWLLLLSAGGTGETGGKQRRNK